MGKRKLQVNWWKKSPHTTKLLKCRFRGYCNFPGEVTGPPTATANRMKISTLDLS